VWHGSGGSGGTGVTTRACNSYNTQKNKAALVLLCSFSVRIAAVGSRVARGVGRRARPRDPHGATHRTVRRRDAPRLPHVRRRRRGQTASRCGGADAAARGIVETCATVTWRLDAGGAGAGTPRRTRAGMGSSVGSAWGVESG